MENIRGIVAAWLLVLTSLLAFSQAQTAPVSARFRVTGVVVDSVGTGESFATLRVFAEGDSIKAAAMGVADVDGNFSLPLPRAGVYDLTVSATGKEDIERTFEVTDARPVFEMGTLTAVTASNILGEVEVTAQRPVVVREIDRIGYDVQADEDSKTQNLDEILKKVPLVTVDPDGTIKVKGSTDFKVYKNNRPNNSFSKNAKDIFKAIPASMIKKIEVITDPGAREDAEGVGVVLNIVTMENTVIKGVMGNVSANWNSSNRVPGANLWITSQINKVTFSVSGGYHHSTRHASRSESEMYRLYEETGNELISRSTSDGSSNMGWVNGDASYELDSLNLFTLELGGWFYNAKQDSHTFTQMSAGGSPIYSYDRNNHTSPYGYSDFNGNFNYQRSTKRKGETFTLSYAISTTKQNQTSTEVYENAVNLPIPYTKLNSNFDLRFVEQTVQADWTRPINERHKFDVGGKFIHRKNHSISTNEYQPVAPDVETYSNFSHLTTIGAIYADYRLKLGRFGARAGVRYEYSHLAAKYRDGSQAPFGSDLNDIVPNAAISWNINDANSIKLSYGNSISRPGISYLNPIHNVGPTSESYGNPNLGSARVQSFNFNYGLIHSKVNIDLNAGYNFSNNGIISSQWTENDITYSTYANGGRTRNFNAGLYFQLTAGPKTTLMANGSLRYSYQRNPSLDIHAEGWSGSVWGRIQQKLPWKLTAALDLNYWGGFQNLYTRFSPEGLTAFNYAISLRRAFLKDDRLNVNIYISNPIGQSSEGYRNVEKNSGYDGYSLSRQFNRKRVMLSVSWRFGSLNASVKKTAKTISNDDLDGQKK